MRHSRQPGSSFTGYSHFPVPCTCTVLAIATVVPQICNWGERERAPSCGLNGRAVTIDIYIYIYRYIDR